MVKVTFQCGHVVDLDPDRTAEIHCLCGERSIIRVEAPPPRFRGHVSGPSAETVPLEPIALDLGSKKMHGEGD